jgi:hypothetical protein
VAYAITSFDGHVEDERSSALYRLTERPITGAPGQKLTGPL